MRNIALLIVFSLFSGFLSAGSGGRKKTDTSVCLTVHGKVLNANEGNDGVCKVELLMNNKPTDSFYLKGMKKKFSFALKRNQHYTIRISKEGMQTKTICVHTTLPSIMTEPFEFEFETSLSEPKPKMQSEPGAPVASIYFHEKKQCFYYHKSFSAYYQKQLCKDYQ